MNNENNQLALIEPSDLSLVSENMLNAKQLEILLKTTPPQYVHKRPAKGGGTWEYVTGGYVRKLLNMMFGWNWSFEIIEQMILHGEVVVKGKLTCKVQGGEIVKMQYGNKEVMCKRGTDQPLSIGNDFKAAATDALKKCAAEIGVAADIYNKQDFKPVRVATESISESKEIERVKKFIMRAKTIEDLNQVNDAILRDNEDLSDLWHLRKEAING